MLVLLTGGTGGAKLVQGFHETVPAAELTIICNTSDDLVMHGLHVAPDVDTILYTLAGISDPLKGWGIAGDSFTVLDQLHRLEQDSWFHLGDRDLATHLLRTRFLREGMSLSRVTQSLCELLGVRAKVIPMSDDPVKTRLSTASGELSFQEYFVKMRCTPEVTRLWYEGAAESRPSPGVCSAIYAARAVILCPSNPATSLGPILAVPGIRDALRHTGATVVAVSPLAGGRAFSGPAHRLMPVLGFEASVDGLAEAYGDFLDLLVMAPEDEASRVSIERRNIEPLVTSIRLDSLEQRKDLALHLLDVLRGN